MIKLFDRSFIRSVGTMIASTVGVGVFGLPQVLQQAGLWVGLVEFLLIGTLVMLTFFMYAEIVMETPGRHRFVSYLTPLLGKQTKPLLVVLVSANTIGALIAFSLIGGAFLAEVTGGLLSETLGSLIVWSLAAVVASQGMKNLSRWIPFIVGIIFLLYTATILLVFPHVQFAHLLQQPTTVALSIFPIGVLIFAFTGMGAVPEMYEIIGRRSKKLQQSIAVGFGLIALLYLLFSVSVIGALGAATPADVFSGLSAILPPWIPTFGALLGALSTISIFTVLASELINAFNVDGKLSVSLAWLLTFIVPLAAIFLPIGSFMQVIGFVGAVLSGLLGLVLVIAYERLKQQPNFSHKTRFRVPTFVSFLVASGFIVGAILQLVVK